MRAPTSDARCPNPPIPGPEFADPQPPTAVPAEPHAR